MSKKLRPISLSVDEPKPGDFHWVLYERKKSGAWDEIQRGDNACDTYGKALVEGVAALQETMEMGKIPINSRPGAVLAPGAAKEEEPAEPPPKRPSLFGFGPAR